MKSVLTDNILFGPPTSFSAVTFTVENPYGLTRHNDKCAFAAIGPYLDSGSSVLDVGCGPNPDLADAILSVDSSYAGLDGDNAVLRDKELALREAEGNKEFICADIEKSLDYFEDDSYDVVLLQSTLCHITPQRVEPVLRNLRRIARQALFVIETSMTRLGNISHPNLFADYIAIDRILMTNQGSTSGLAEKLPGVLTAAFPLTPLEMFRIDDRPEGDYREELEYVCENLLANMYYYYSGRHSAWIMDRCVAILEYLHGPEVSFVPFARVVAHIPA